MATFPMPTDGAEFEKNRRCYGKAYVAARDGASSRDVATFLIQGLEKEIRYVKGMPAFPAFVELLIAGSGDCDHVRFFSEIDRMKREFADSPLTRNLAEAVEKIGFSEMGSGSVMSEEIASQMIITHLGCAKAETMEGYIERNCTHDLGESRLIVEGFKKAVVDSTAVRELAGRMLGCSEKGLPARAEKAEPVIHTAAGLNEEI